MIQKAILLCLVLILSLGTLSAQKCDLVLRGRVLHLENNQPIEAAYIWLSESATGVVTDANGNFMLKNLCQGQQTIQITFIGHKEIKQSIGLNSAINNLTFKMEEESVALGTVDVHGHREAVQTTTAVSTLYGEALLQSRGESLGESLKRVAGVSTFSTGNTISKPVIHGLHSNRILILNNGIRLEGQQWGAEHAPEIDPFLADELTVIKGAETVRYGPEAMGGVILVNPPALPTSKKYATELNLVGNSNGGAGNVAVSHAGGSGKYPGLGYRIQGATRRAGNIQTPTYNQGNTGMSEASLSGALGYSSPKIGTEAYYSFFTTELGILRDAHTGNLSDLLAIIENGAPFAQADFTYTINNPKQVVTHHLAKLKAHYHLNPSWKLNFQYGFQQNNRQEFDRRRGELNTRPSLDLELFTNTAELILEHNLKSQWTGSMGIHLIQQANSNVPGTGVTPLIPNYDLLNGALELEAGLRYDYRTVSAARYVGKNLQEATMTYQNGSLFFGGRYQINSNWSFTSNLGTAWRPPNVNELFSQGLHHGAAAVELGDANLDSEKSLKWVNGLEYEGKRSTLELAAYANQIRDYIYLNPTGETFVSLRGTFNVYEYLQANAFFYGLDISGTYSFTEQLNGYAKGSIIRAKNTQSDTFFPFIPSDRMDWGLSYSLGENPDQGKNRITISNVLVAKQHREPEFDLAPAPPAYALINLGYSKKLKLFKNTLSLSLQVNNLLNSEFKEYMNRFRYFTADMGRNFQLKFNYQF